MNNNNLQFYCRICGYKNLNKPWGIDNKTPTFDICSCCGVEFGYEDNNLNSILSYRSNWIANGYNWFDIKLKPNNWDFNIQRLNIPEKYNIKKN